MTLHTMLVMYYKRNDVPMDLTVKNIFTDHIDIKHIGRFKRKEILNKNALEKCKVDNFDFVGETLKIDLYNKYRCTKKEFQENFTYHI